MLWLRLCDSVRRYPSWQGVACLLRELYGLFRFLQCPLILQGHLFGGRLVRDWVRFRFSVRVQVRLELWVRVRVWGRGRGRGGARGTASNVLGGAPGLVQGTPARGGWNAMQRRLHPPPALPTVPPLSPAACLGALLWLFSLPRLLLAES